MLVRIMLYSAAGLFITFSAGALLLGILGDRLSAKTSERVRSVGWVVAGLMFGCVGLGILTMVWHQIGVGTVTLRSRAGTGFKFGFESSPFLFVLAMSWELFCSGLLLVVSAGYLRRAMT